MAERISDITFWTETLSMSEHLLFYLVSQNIYHEKAKEQSWRDAPAVEGACCTSMETRV